MKTYSCGGKVRDGTLHLSHRSRLDRWIAKLKNDTTLWVVFEIGTKRSNEFNRYYFGACQYVAEKLAEMGCGEWTNEDVHELSKRECNSTKRMLVNVATGELVEQTIPGSTRNMGTVRFLEYKERFMQFWAEHNIYVPDEYWLE